MRNGIGHGQVGDRLFVRDIVYRKGYPVNHRARLPAKAIRGLTRPGASPPPSTRGEQATGRQQVVDDGRRETCGERAAEWGRQPLGSVLMGLPGAGTAKESGDPGERWSGAG